MGDYIISLTTKTVCFVNKSGGIIVKKGGISMGSSYKDKVVEEISKCENDANYVVRLVCSEVKEKYQR